EPRRWLLLADAGTPLKTFGNPPEQWLEVLPRYAELQRGEAARDSSHIDDHMCHGVPDLRVATMPERFEQLLGEDLPLEADEVERLRGFEGRLEELCDA